MSVISVRNKKDTCRNDSVGSAPTSSLLKAGGLQEQGAVRLCLLQFVEDISVRVEADEGVEGLFVNARRCGLGVQEGFESLAHVHTLPGIVVISQKSMLADESDKQGIAGAVPIQFDLTQRRTGSLILFQDGVQFVRFVQTSVEEVDLIVVGIEAVHQRLAGRNDAEGPPWHRCR